MTIFITKGTLQLIKEYGNDYDCMELLQFFGKYPYTRFNRLAVIHALNNNGNSHRVENALKRLVDNKLVDACSEQGTSLYSLTGEKTLRDVVSKIATLDLPQRHVLFKNNNDCYQEQPDNSLKESNNKTLSFTGPVIREAGGPLLSIAVK